MSVALGILAAYLLGAIPTSYLAARFGAGIDLREHGSKNLGATNLYRVLGARYAYPVGLFDVLKGVIPVVGIAPAVGGSQWTPLVVGGAAVLGHVYPVYLGFKGGKGVATAAGVVVAVAPLATAASLVVWAAVLAVLRIMSVASMSAAVVFPVAAALLYPANRPLLIAGTVMGAFIIFTHRTNIRRLLAGTEPRLTRSRRQEA